MTATDEETETETETEHSEDRANDPRTGASLRADLDAYLGERVVLDTATTLVYLGTLAARGADYLLLLDADVHDARGGTTTKERYALEARKSGIRKNRDEVLVRTDLVASISRLSDVTLY